MFRSIFLLMVFFVFYFGEAKAEEWKPRLVELSREKQVERFVFYNNAGQPCDYPISLKILEKGETYVIFEDRCKKHIYKKTCHDDHDTCFVERRKKK